MCRYRHICKGGKGAEAMYGLVAVTSGWRGGRGGGGMHCWQVVHPSSSKRKTYPASRRP